MNRTATCLMPIPASILLRLAMLLVFLACVSPAICDTADQIIGRWEHRESHLGKGVFTTAKDEKELVMEYFKDGTFNLSIGPSGKYKVLDGTLLRRTTVVDGKVRTKEYKILISGDTLTLTSASPKIKEIYQRLR